MKVVVLGFDGLAREYVDKYKLRYLKQEKYVETKLDDFRVEGTYTPVIWSSMLTGEIDRELEKVF